MEILNDFTDAKIKSLKIELPNYDFDHSPMSPQQEYKWLERNIIEKKLKGILTSKNSSGAYLITGYRGMGKTSFVRKVLDECEKKTNENKIVIKKIEINFGQKDILELDILRQIIKGLKDKIVFDGLKKLYNSYLNIKALPFYAAILFILFTFGFSPKEISKFFLQSNNQEISIANGDQEREEKESISIIIKPSNDATKLNSDYKFHKKTTNESNFTIEFLVTNLSIAVALTFLMIVLFQFLLKNVFKELELFDKLSDLYDRCRSEIIKESGAEGTNDKFPFRLGDKSTKKFPIANPKEVENEILSVLRTIEDENEAQDVKVKDGIIYLMFLVSITFFVYLLWALIHLIFDFHYSSFSFLSKDFFKSIPLLICAVLPAILIIHLLLISCMHKIYGRKLRFVFVFDEIDKIDPATSPEKYHEELSSFEKQQNHGRVQDFRERKKVVITVLAGLKYLITSAKAKFIFIAGREMFDASMADIADRQSSLGSIFNAVINVDSLLKEDKFESSTEADRSSTVSAAIEKYLIRILLPENQNNDSKELFLKKYYNYLDQNLKIPKEDSKKVIYTLQHLITYLTYRSNGSPKKLIRLIEEFIEVIEPNTKDEYLITTKNEIRIFQKVKPKGNRYALKFNYYDQYKIGYINYLIRPFLISYGPFFKRYSDRILFSTPFLIDHIFKFHPFAFSIQNLELIPEVLSETRNPELRNFINDLVNFYSLNHLRESEIGLFEYKFFNKTYLEMVYLCKIFEDESAAFNFTLDETYQVKLHIRNNIKELRSIHKEFLNEKNSDDIKSISFLNEINGDSQYFDQEFDEAVGSYLDATQKLEHKVVYSKDQSISLTLIEFVNYIRLKLKLGLIYERMKSFEAALFTYVSINDIILEYTYNNLEDLKYHQFSAKSDLMQIVIQPFLAELFMLEKYSVEGVTFPKLINSQNKINDLFNHIKGQSNTIILSNYYSAVGTLLFYKNFSFINNTDEKYFKATSSKVNLLKDSADIESGEGKDLYKIFFFDQDSKQIPNKLANPDYRFDSTHFSYFKTTLYLLIKPYISIDKSNWSILDLLNETEKILSSLTPQPLLNSQRIKDYNRSFFKNVSITLAKLGDSLLSSISQNEKFKIDEIQFIELEPKEMNIEKFVFSTLSFKIFNINFNIQKDSHKFQLILCIYFWASQFAFRSGRNLAVSFQYRKIILLSTRLFDKIILQKMESFFENYLFKSLLRISHWNSNTSERFQIYKFKNYFDINSFYTPLSESLYNYTNISNSPEIKEGLFLYANYLIEKAENEAELIIILNKISNLVTPYNTISTQYARTIELVFKEKTNCKRLELSANCSKLFNLTKDFLNFDNDGFWKKFMRAAISQNNPTQFINSEFEKLNIFTSLKNNQTTISETISFLKELIQITADSIFCLHQTISIYNGYGISYFINYTSLANQHSKLGKWLMYVEFCKLLFKWLISKSHLNLAQHNNQDYNIEEKLNNLLGNDIIKTTDSIAQFHLALQNYARAKQLHNEGLPYKTLTSNMYYLEDDYNDGLFHFCIALERLAINTGKNRAHIVELEKIVSASQVYDKISYFN